MGMLFYNVSSKDFINYKLAVGNTKAIYTVLFYSMLPLLSFLAISVIKWSGILVIM